MFDLLLKRKTYYFVMGSILGLFASIAYGSQEDKVERLGSSQSVYERKAVMVLPEVGFESHQWPVKTAFCAHGKCRAGGRWSFPVTEHLKRQVGQEVMSWLFQKRFDVITLEPGALSISTADQKISVPAKGLKGFRTGILSAKAYQQRLEQYLNTSLVSFILPLQQAALEQRYAELSEKERATFIRTQAKSLGLPLDVVPMLLDSQYVMALYQPKSEGKLTITYIKPKDKPAYYDNDLTFDLSNQLFIYRYQSATHQFKLFRVLTGESGRTGASLSTPYRPSRVEQVQGLFEKAVQSALRASLIQLVHQMKDIDQFQMAETVQSVDWRTVKANLSAQEDLRIDALYRVQRTVEGQKETVGLLKARQVAKAKGSQSLPSEFKLVKGEVEPLDQLTETSWMGSYWGVDLLSQDYQFDKVSGVDVLKPAQKVNWLRWQARIDQGYFKNDPDYTESWMSMHIALGAGDGDLKTQSASLQWKTPIGLRFGMDFMDHNTLGWGWSVGYGFGFDLNWLSFESAKEGGDSLSYASIDATGRAELTYLLSEKSQLGFYAAYPLSITSQSKVGEVEINTNFTPGLMMGVGYQHAFSTLGFLHRFYHQ